MRQIPRRLGPIVLICAVIGGGACGQPQQMPGAGDDWLNPDDVDQPVDPGDPNAPKQMIYAGRYELNSVIDLAGAGAFGETISGTLVQLSQFHENPAGTILNLLAIYHTPYYTQVWNALPGFLKDQLESLLNEYLFQTLFEAVPAIDHAVQLVDDVASVSRNVQMTSELVLRGPFSGQMRGAHTIKGIGFTLWDHHAYIALPDALGPLVSAQARGVLKPIYVPGGAQGALEFTRQDFSLPYGNMIMDAVAQMVFIPKGTTNLAGYLNKIIGCPDVAQWLGNQCVLGACFKDLVSIDSLSGVCTDGLNLVGFLVEAKIRSLKLDLLDLESGKCLMYDKGYEDTVGDYKVSAITDGQWSTMITISGVQKKVMAPFDGKRIADQ